MQRILFFLAATSILFVACKTDGDQTGDLTLKVTATYDGEPLVNLDQTYAYPDATPVKFQLFNYYLSDISLFKEGEPNADAYLLSEVELIEYADFYTTELAEQGIQLQFKDIPDGVYSGLRMGIGLAPDLNDTQPGDYSAGHALTNNYWSWARGYVFAKIEGNADLDGDGEFTNKLTYHMGQDDMYKIIEFNTPITIKNGQPVSTPINVDLLNVIRSIENDYLDINLVENTQDHTNDENIYRFLFTNLTNAITVGE